VWWWERFDFYWEAIAGAAAILGPVLSTLTIGWILATKKNATSAVAWCLLVIFLPLVGPLFFILFGYQHVNRPLSRKRQHKKLFQRRNPPSLCESIPGIPERPNPVPEAVAPSGASWEEVARLACRFGAFPVTMGNWITPYQEGAVAFEAMLAVVRTARHHVHLETFIFQPDAVGRQFLDTLTQAARRGVEVRLLYDAMGTYRLSRALLQPLKNAGGNSSVFLPINPLRRRIQINMRNHRKILVVDGRTAFAGGLNVGDEYRSRSARFGYWRDTQVRLEGPAVAGLQRIFAEDWDFAANENLQDPDYFPHPQADGPCAVQVVESGPDREVKAIREIYFAAILRARQRVWIASPYFIPDAGLLDALCLAGYLGVDVRLLTQYHPDKWIPYFAARYYFDAVLRAGVKVYQYTKGMLHSKVIMVDGLWASVGTANLDNRSMYLNFEVNCLVYAPPAVAELEAAFRQDLADAIQLERGVYARRPFSGRLLDNACRLLSPIL
jgi:cardiolipin synthase